MIIDIRERRLSNAIGFQHTIKQLDLGDVHIKDGENVVCIIERKTVSDLAASIKDGRYEEQKQRLLSHRSQYGTNIVYIVEGFQFIDDGMAFGIPRKALVSCFIHSSLRDGFNMFASHNITDTCNIIKALLARKRAFEQKTTDYMHTIIKPKKKDNITQRSILLNQLAAMPGISIKKASTIAQDLHVNSMFQLINKFNDKEGCYMQLKALDGIGKKLAAQIAGLLYAN